MIPKGPFPSFANIFNLQIEFDESTGFIFSVNYSQHYSDHDKTCFFIYFFIYFFIL